MPLNYESYIEVFGGAAWVLFGMEKRCGHEVYNDYNSNLVNLFDVVKNRVISFLVELGFLPLNSRDEFFSLKRTVKGKQFGNPHLKEEMALATEMLDEQDAAEICRLLMERSEDTYVQRAAAFYKVIRYSYASKGRSFGCKSFDIYNTFSLIWSANRRLRNTTIENQNFERLIKHYDRPDAFLYCDPPYYSTENHYDDVNFEVEDHTRLRDTLATVQGKWLLSYNDDPYIRELYKDYHIEEVERLDNIAQRYESGKVYRELLISNYDTTERKKSVPEQTSLFDVLNGMPSRSGPSGATVSLFNHIKNGRKSA